jgi:hypothetical protein
MPKNILIGRRRTDLRLQVARPPYRSGAWQKVCLTWTSNIFVAGRIGDGEFDFFCATPAATKRRRRSRSRIRSSPLTSP